GRLIRAGRCAPAAELVSCPRVRAGRTARPDGAGPTKEVVMLDLIADFFTQLADRGAGSLPGDLTATLRFDVTEAGSVRHWRVAIDHGRVEVTDSGADADCVLTGEAAVFEELVTGRRNPMAA